MKILYIYNSIFLTPRLGSGSNTHNVFLQKAFEEMGHRVIWLEPGSGGKEKEKSLKIQRSIYTFLKLLLPQSITSWCRDLYTAAYDFGYESRISALIEDQKPDFVYERYTEYHGSGMRAAKKAGLPYVAEIHDPPEARSLTQRLNFHSYNSRVQLWVARAADVLVVVNSYMKQFFVARGVLSNKIIVLPNAVDSETFRPTGCRRTLRKELGLSEKFVVGFVGTMQPYHGIEFLPTVCNIVRRKCPNICFLMVGSFIRYKGGKQKYVSILKQKGVENNFVLTGGVPIEDVSAYIEAMDICLVPNATLWSSPTKLFEYGALAKPCVVPRYLGIQDVLSDGKNGIIFEAKSVEDMVGKILLLAQDESLRSRLAMRWHHDVLTKHTWKRNAEKITQKVASLSKLHDE